MLGLASFFLSLIAQSISSAQVPIDVVKILVEATASVLGFGGVIFGVIFGAQRSLLSKLRARTNQLNAKIKDIKNPITDAEKIEHNQLTSAIDKGSKIYFSVRDSFFVAFSSLGAGLVLQLIHLAAFDVMNKVRFCMFSATYILISIEIALMTVAVVSFILAMLTSTDLPLEPN